MQNICYYFGIFFEKKKPGASALGFEFFGLFSLVRFAFVVHAPYGFCSVCSSTVLGKLLTLRL
jgi:hypothetical protein